MVTLNFCTTCGGKKVQDVKQELEKLVTEKDFSSDVCNICCEPIPSGSCQPATSEEQSVRNFEHVVKTENYDTGDDDVAMAMEEDTSDGDEEEASMKNETGDNLQVRISTADGMRTNVKSEPDLKYTNRILDDAHFRLTSLRPELSKLSEVANDETFPYKCKLCKKKKKFRAVNFLVTHLASHLDNKEVAQTPYQCNNCCNTLFKTKRQWARHVKVYQCRDPSCRKRFMSKQSQVAHEKNHNESDLRLYKCSLCDRSFFTSSAWSDHQRTHGNKEPRPWTSSADSEIVNENIKTEPQDSDKESKPFKCNKCSQHFVNQDLFLGHMRKMHQPRIARPVAEEEQSDESAEKQCNETENPEDVQSAAYQAKKEEEEDIKLIISSLRSELKQLLKDNDDTCTMFACSKCTAAPFETFNSFITHVRMHVGKDVMDKPYQCNKCCQMKFKYLLDWRKHIRPYKCEMANCKYRAPTRPTARQHFTQVHTNAEKRFKCDKCPKAFHTNYDLRIHEQTVHEKVKRFTCSSCGLQFFLQSRLISHERTHSNEKPFQCDVCGMSFKTSRTLRNHRMDHTGEKPFVCEQCGFATKWKDGLHAHQQTHLTKGAYECDVCGMQIRCQSLLERHKRIHTGEKVYKCRYCEEHFMYRETQYNHEKKHHPELVGPAKHICNVCCKTFVSHARLQKHALIHSDGKPYQCLKCSFRTNHKSSLNDHQKVHERKHST